MVSNISTKNIFYNKSGQHEYHVAPDVDNRFSDSIFTAVQDLEIFSQKSKEAVSKLNNVIVLKNSQSQIPDKFEKTNHKFHKYAQDAFGMVSKADNAIVVVEDNHGRKRADLEGDIFSQGADTVTHEVGHLIDKEYSASDKFKAAYLEDLKSIEAHLKQNPDEKICGESLKDIIVYLKHYYEGADFSDGIDETDITREGLRENFAECFSTMADSLPTKINKIYTALFPNTMAVTKEFVI